MTTLYLESNRSALSEIVNSFRRSEKEPFNHVLIISHGAVAMLFRLYFLGGKLLWDEQKIDNCHWVEYWLER